MLKWSFFILFSFCIYGPINSQQIYFSVAAHETQNHSWIVHAIYAGKEKESSLKDDIENAFQKLFEDPVVLSIRNYRPDNQWIPHNIYADNPQISPLEDILEVSFEEKELDSAVSMLQAWIDHQNVFGNSLSILYDEHNFAKPFLDQWNGFFQKNYPGLEIQFLNIRTEVRNSLGKQITTKGTHCWDYQYENVSQPYFEARIKYLIHSHPLWKMLDRTANKSPYPELSKDTIEVVRSQNFEQLRAYFWTTGLFRAKSTDKKEKYWPAFFVGYLPRINFPPGSYICEDCGIVYDAPDNGTGYASGGDEGVLDIYPAENNMWVVFAIGMTEIYNRGFETTWKYSTSESLHASFEEFMSDLETHTK